MNYLHQILTVTRWEYGRFFKPKNEVLGIVIMLVISAVFYLGSTFALSDKRPTIEVLLYHDVDSALTKFLVEGFTVRQISADHIESYKKDLTAEKNIAVLDLSADTIGLYAYKYNRDIKKLKRSVDVYYKQREMKKLGLRAEQLAFISSPAPLTESYRYTDNAASRVVLAYFFAGLMILAVFLSFAYQFTAITGEKQLKITEQIVSAITPQVWMDGKILGITLTGLSSMLTYSLLSVAGGVLFFQFTGMPVSGILEYLYFPSIALYLPFALIGVLLWNAILAAIASVITDPNNSGKSSLMLLPVIFVVASFLVTRDPDGYTSVFLSWFPLTSATSMPMRWAITEVGIWQLIGSFLLLVLTFYFFRTLAAKIFRVSILMTGKEPTWSEVYRLLKMT
jgi:ABC-2 type transport system permease protein